MPTPKSLPFSSSHSRFIVAALLIALVFFVCVPCRGAVNEEPASEWSLTYGKLEGHCVAQTADGGYVIAGTGKDLSGSSIAVLLKIDSSGELSWTKTYGTDFFGGSNNAVSVVQTSSGYTLFGEGGYLVQTDTAGNFTLRRTLGFKGVKVGILASDGNYVLAGNMQLTNGSNVGWLLKTDKYGNMLWNRTFAGAFYPNALTETYDFGYVLAGSRENDFWFVKTDSNGELLWNQNYSYGGNADKHSIRSIVKTQDGGFALIGSGDWQASGGSVPWLIKTNSQGNAEWDYPYSGLKGSVFVSAVQTADGGYIVLENSAAIIVKMNSTGNILWQARFGDISTYRSTSMIQTEDKGYLVLGTNNADITWLVKITPEPDIVPPRVSILSPEAQTSVSGDVELTFRVSEQASWFAYSLDGQENVTITGNTTLPSLTKGPHNIKVYAADLARNTGASETIYFTVTEPFAFGWLTTIVAAVAAVCVALLLIVKRSSLKAMRKRGIRNSLRDSQKNGFIKSVEAFSSKTIVKSLIIISLCLVLVLFQVFFPFLYYSAKNSSSKFEVGVSYVYEEDNLVQIFDEVEHIQALGFKVIRVNLVCATTGVNDYPNGLTDVFFAAAEQFHMKVVFAIQNHDSTDKVQYYLNRWGKHLWCVQVLNEPELSSSWDAGALFTDDEVFSKFQNIYKIVEPYRASMQLQLYTNFGAGFIVRSNVPIQLSKNLDFVGFDVYMESILTLSPNFVQLLHKMTNKDVVISEFGMSTSDDTAQSNYIIQGLNLFKSMELKGCWIAYWNSVDNIYGIRGRLAEKTVSEWIDQNASAS